MEKLKEQAKKQDQERLDQSVRRAVQRQMHLYENRLQNAEDRHQEEQESLRRELRLAQEELERITEQAVSLRKHIEALQEKKDDQREQRL